LRATLAAASVARFDGAMSTSPRRDMCPSPSAHSTRHTSRFVADPSANRYRTTQRVRLSELERIDDIRGRAPVTLRGRIDLAEEWSLGDVYGPESMRVTARGVVRIIGP